MLKMTSQNIVIAVKKDADSVTANPIYDTADTNDYEGYMHLKKCE